MSYKSSARNEVGVIPTVGFGVVVGFGESNMYFPPQTIVATGFPVIPGFGIISDRRYMTYDMVVDIVMKNRDMRIITRNGEQEIITRVLSDVLERNHESEVI